MTTIESTHPETAFAIAPQGRVAYRLSGAGPRDVVMNPGLWSHIELIRDDPGHVTFRQGMQSFSRFISFDCLGTGLSDRPATRSMAEVTLTKLATQTLGATWLSLGSRMARIRSSRKTPGLATSRTVIE